MSARIFFGSRCSSDRRRICTFESLVVAVEVKTPSRQAGDDVFELASLYNSIFLPLKDREGGQEQKSAVLGIDDLRSFVEKD